MDLVMSGSSVPKEGCCMSNVDLLALLARLRMLIIAGVRLFGWISGESVGSARVSLQSCSSTLTGASSSVSLSRSSRTTAISTVCECLPKVGSRSRMRMPLMLSCSFWSGLSWKQPISSANIIKSRSECYYTRQSRIPQLFLYSYMNLTINNSSKIAQLPRPSPLAAPAHRRPEEPTQPLSPPAAQCTGFFSNCMGGQLPPPQIHEFRQELRPRRPLEPCYPPSRCLLQNSEEPTRRCKISLSLNLKHSKFRTPSKEKPSGSHRHASEHKKFKTEQGSADGHGKAEQGRLMKLKTEPKKERRSEETTHQLKESRKPSTQIGSVHSAKKSSDSSKMKLTLSAAFRSQLHHSPSPSSPSPLPTSFLPQQPPPSSVVIEESFMTARLANIYAGSELQLFPNSNIVYYNQLMANEWRGQEEREKPRGDISIQNIPDDPPEEPSIKSKFKERRWIGEYAKTIKTFNESELRSNELNSEAESIVLEKGCAPFNAVMPANRGSIKECGQGREGERGRRGYGSVGEQYGAFSASNESKFKKLTSPPIAEDLYDSEHNYE